MKKRTSNRTAIRLPRGGISVSKALGHLAYLLTCTAVLVLIGLLGFIDPDHGRPSAWTQTVVPAAALIGIVMLALLMSQSLRSLRLLPVMIAAKDDAGTAIRSAAFMWKATPVRGDSERGVQLVFSEVYEQGVNPFRRKRNRMEYHLHLAVNSGDEHHFRLIVWTYVRDYDWCGWAEREFARHGIEATASFQRMETPSPGADVVEP